MTGGDRMRREARRWFVTRQGGELDVEQAEAFARWLQVPAHRDAFTAVERLWGELGPPALRLGEQQRRNRVRMAVGIAAAAGLASLAIVIGRPEIERSPTVAETTEARFVESARGRTVSEVLSDGSRVTIGPLSRLVIRYESRARVVELAAGEAYFEVVADPSRPFRVKAGTARVEVVGTRFDVRRFAGRTLVAVESGAVSVQGRGGESLSLAAGHEIAVGDDGLMGELKSRSPGASAWREGWLVYESVTLTDVVADLGRYRSEPIRVASPDVGALRITASVRAKDIGTLLDQLPHVLPVAVEQHSDGAVLIRRRP